MCDVLSVSESGFAAWRAGSTAKRRLSTPQLEAVIRAIHAEFDGAYGAPRMAREIKARGLPVSKERVRKLMQAQWYPRQTQTPLQGHNQLCAPFAGRPKRSESPVSDDGTRQSLGR